jgi:hypothetical protein
LWDQICQSTDPHRSVISADNGRTGSVSLPDTPGNEVTNGGA